MTVFGLCHHGHAYFGTSHPCRHPSLPDGLDLAGAQIDALHRLDIRAPIYLSAQVNEYAANEHPEWLAVDTEGRQVKRLPADPPPRPPEVLNAGWQVLDMSSPYQDYLADLIEQVLRRYSPVDGIFLDMCWDQPSVSKWALAGMAKRRFNPRSAVDRQRYAREVALAYMKRFSMMVEDAARGFNHNGIWFNSRPKTNLHVEKRFLRHIEIEALPTGGWGYAYFPYVARFVRPLGLPTLSHTGRFFKSWGDNAGLKPHAALKYECCQILSQGMTIGVGDLLHPRGVPNPSVYDLIGGVYRYIERCQAVAAGGRLQSEIAVVVDPELGDRPGSAGLGVTWVLQQLQLQFDIVPPKARLDRYPVTIVLSNTPVDESFRVALREYVAGGGALMLCGSVALGADGAPLLDEQGIEVNGQSPYSTISIRPARVVLDGLEDFDHALYESGFRMVPVSGSRSLARVVEPYFERSHDRFSGHSYTPPNRLSRYSAIVLNRPEAGGAVITTSAPLFAAYGRNAVPWHRRLIGNCLALLLPRPLVQAPGAPSLLEATVLRKGAATIVHILSFVRERRGELEIIEDAMPLVDQPISIRTDRPPRCVEIAPHGELLDHEYFGGYATVRVTLHDGHGMLVCR